MNIKTRKPSRTFLDRIVDFDFDKRYTMTVRMVAHFAVWTIYLLLFFLANRVGYNYTFPESIMMAFRGTMLNVIVFYIFFYIVIPHLFDRNYIFLTGISIFLLIELFLFLNIIFYKLIILIEFPIESDYLVDLMERAKSASVWKAFSPQLIFGRSFEVIIGLSPLLFIKITFDLTRTYARSVRANRRVETLKREKLKMENKFLNAQLNPHFLFNTLNNLYGLTLKKDDLAPELVMKFSDAMRYTLYEANTDFIPLKKELDFIGGYVELEQMRTDQPITLKKNILDPDTSRLQIAPLLPFVFIENAFKYGLKSDTPFLNITIRVKDQIFYFEIENDYLSKKAGNQEIGGIGIKNVKRRLALLYPEKHDLEIISNENSYRVRLTVNLSDDVE